MKVYKCLITGDELFTDVYNYVEKDGLLVVRGKYITRSKGDKIDEKCYGGNASAEEPKEAEGEETTESGCNVCLDGRFGSTGFGTKKEYLAYFKDYVKALENIKKQTNPDMDFVAWRAEMTETYKSAVASFKDYEFYTGESNDPAGMIVLVKWQKPEGEDEEVPFVYFYKEGIKEEKY
ncbi:RNA-directed DNA polymerase from mobile element jockey-like [Plakobranchus ocellatus]|uniref:RNA-directed DNA polymerase from mobile element jockey-like n=1 Tax=Plakobranchus ocellatus TaxID=259542 RepID=A0AAV3XUX9_9GAST|nr:RNA-directed DNA polymerase from mobile element jockey-like [Plakobranchus ocellatus]